MILLISFAFLAGIVTVLSPCILPVLPIVLSSSLGQGKERPLGVVVGFVLSFTFFTLFLTTIVRAFGIPADTLRLISIVVIFVFGVSLLIPRFQVLLERLFTSLSKFAPRGSQRQGFSGGLLIGFSIGLLWTPCVGPILASVISLALTGSVTTTAFFITLAYSLGTAIPMFLLILGGQNALQKVPWLTANTLIIQKIFGVVMILMAVAIYLNFDRRIQSYILEKFPNYGVGLTKFEENKGVQDALKNLQGKPKEEDMGKPTFQVLEEESRAPELIPGGKWFNTSASSVPDLPELAKNGEALKSLKGKVILIDFWTYTCINCIRTLPYLKSWHEKYKDLGLVIIGVHTPEFEFEKDPENLKEAIGDFGIGYPVMQDNNYATWDAYDNNFWPAKYLIDKEGRIRYNHFGEGEYDKTEEVIRTLLTEAGTEVSDVPIKNPSYQILTRTPELYLGYARAQFLASPDRVVSDTPVRYSKPQSISNNFFAFEGEWTVGAEYAMPTDGAKLYLNFEAKDVFLVARPRGKINGEFKILLNDKEVGSSDVGEDVKGGSVLVDEDRLYRLLNLETPGRNILILEFLDDNLQVYAFTFG